VRKLQVVYERHPPTLVDVYLLYEDSLQKIKSWFKKMGLTDEEIDQKLRERFSWLKKTSLTQEELEQKIDDELRRLMIEATPGEEMEAIEFFKKHGLAEESKPVWRENWEQIRQLVQEKIRGIDPARLKVYADSRRNESDVEELKEEIEKGLWPEVYRDLLNLGAQFRPTEEEEVFNMYEEIEEGCKEKCKEPELRGKVEALCIMARNIAIANRINEDLKEGETGILFIGAAHKGIEKFISPSIQYEVIFDWDKW
jgi:hypothetical protein